MKRRDFLVASAGAAGIAALPRVSEATSKPCPPGTLGVAGGSTVNQACVAGDAEADWLARSQGPNVVWAHDFRNAAEFTQFAGFKPGYETTDTCTRYTGDGIGKGACLQYKIPKGIPDGYHYVYNDSVSGWLVVDGTALSQPVQGASNADWTWKASGTQQVVKGSWMRPFAALIAGQNGLAADDPAASGSVLKRSLNSTPSSNFHYFRMGYYGHSSYHTQYPTWTTNAPNGGDPVPQPWDGTDFYIQFRTKISASRFGKNTQKYPNGKLVILGTVYNTPNQVMVIQSLNHDPRYNSVTSAFGMYAHTDQSSGNYVLSDPPFAPNNSAAQPRGEYDSSVLAPKGKVCKFYYSLQDCWEWPPDVWVTVLVHIIPGRYNVGVSEANWVSAPYKDTGLQVWVAPQGQTTYTKLWDVTDDGSGTGFPFWFGSDGAHPPGYNAFIPSGYMNNQPSIAEWTQRFTQIIFSKQFIPCPLA